MNIYKLILGAGIAVFSSSAFANETFRRALEEKRFEEARLILKRDPSVDILWAPHANALPAIALIIDEGAAQEELLKAAVRRFTGREATHDRKTMRALAKDTKSAKGIFKTGLEYDQFGTPFLMWACFEGNLELVKHFFEKIPAEQINTVFDVIGNTPLHYAIAGDAWDVVEYLFDLGVNLEARNARGETPLIRAIKTLLDSAKKRGCRAAHTLKIVELLTGLGARDARRKLKESHFLLGVRPDEVDLDGMAALHYAARLAEPTIAHRLIQAGASVDLAAPNGLTPLRIAVRAGRKKVATLFLRAGINRADPDQQSDDGTSALHDAASNGQLDFVRLLVEAGAQVDMANANGETPLELAQERHPRVADFLRERGAVPERRLVRSRSFDVVPVNRRGRDFELAQLQRAPTDINLVAEEEEALVPPNKRRNIFDLTDPTAEPAEMPPAAMEIEPQLMMPVMTRDEILRDILRMIGVIGVNALYHQIKFGKKL